MNNVAVILPIYKGDKLDYIILSLNSLLNQSYKQLLIYIGIDGPVSEDVVEYLHKYEHHSNINIVYFSKNRGLACVLNDLLTKAHQDGYEYFARMDADDIAKPDRIKKQMTFLCEHPEIDVVGGSIEEIDEQGYARGKTIIYPNTPEKCRAFFAYRNPHAHPAVLFRWRFFEKSGCLYRPEYRQNQDTMLWFDGLRKDVKMANIPDVILQFRMTKSLFKKRRNGWSFAKKQLNDRLLINKELKYGFGAYLFAYAMFILLISPSWLKKVAYRFCR